MKKICITALALIALFPAIASAHTLKVSGDVGVLMHIDPNDDPVATQPAQLYVTVTNKASGAVCGCTLRILDGSTTVYAASLSGTGATLSFVFPHAGVYDIAVKNASSSMPSFSVDFTQRVEVPAGSAADTNQTIWLYIGGGIAIVAVVVGGLFISRKN